MRRSKVLFPEPDGPSTARHSAGSTSSEIPSSAVSAPDRFASARMTSAPLTLVLPVAGRTR